jgi:glutamate/tyrosine decarboxylase-like PLP-dependent enzyme
MERTGPDERWGEDTADLLRATSERAFDYLQTLPSRRVGPTNTLAGLRSALGRPLTDEPVDPAQVIDDLVADTTDALMAMSGPRFFGFVIGGSLPVAIAADWLTIAWDQNAGLYGPTPAAAVVEEVAAEWLLDLLDLPHDASVGFTTGCQMAHFTALAAARRSVLLRAGWDVERKGLHGAPPVRVVVGDEVHVTVPIALQMLGLGTDNMERVAADAQGRMRPAALAKALGGGDPDVPTIVCAQAGNVNTGAFDPLDEIAPIVRRSAGAWLHVDGAFGLWARVVPELAHLAAGAELADSWASDAHKWLNVPFDSGIVMVRDRDAHRAAMMLKASYLVQATGDERDPSNFVPEFSRRARGFAVYAALRALGRRGVTEMIGRGVRIAQRMADSLRGTAGIAILNDVVLNQVLVRFDDDDDLTRDVIRRVQEDGTCWLGGSTWQGRQVMRISVSNWSTTEADADLSVAAILRCYHAAIDSRKG